MQTVSIYDSNHMIYALTTTGRVAGGSMAGSKRGEDPIRFHHFDVIIRSHILILGVDPTVKHYSSATVM